MTCGSFWQIPDWNLESVLGFFWDALKAAVPAVVSWVAYTVSIEAKEATKAQRDIAANQYKISLYEVRKKTLSSLDYWISSNAKFDPERIFEMSSINNILIDIQSCFVIDIDMQNIKDRVKYIDALSLEISSDDIYNHTFLTSGQRLDAKVLGTQKSKEWKYFHLKEQLGDRISKISTECRNQLRIPPSPY